ncbi:diaminopimelate epimerase [Sphingomonas sp. RG327]|jgi:diaminopimelate epimerase|uniref:Diaminopimelate epimerase n=1 Tax=Sphingomonas anseongensis TaxID=2908207 RepID=A0ABT0RDZ0_9SPHN|nr:diaminopimelate epimerase [Sphingomonas anseongensis]MCL6678494.1 diaminopimelate epimerase [Sphingomonas anseongensis]
MALHFHKMHGLGNDFVIVDGREQSVTMTPELARAIADRHRGVGCDQLILIGKSDKADVSMRIWNHDGGEVQSCGNASRCVVALTGAKTIETPAGVIEGSSAGSEVEVGIREPRFGWEDIPLSYAMDTSDLPLAWDGLKHGFAVNVGNPHVVFFVEDPAKVPLDVYGPRIENDPAFPERVNVHVAAVREDGIHMRSWERGAGLTLACGTGACAAAVAAIATKRATSPVAVHMPGGTLTISWKPGETVKMRGSATHVFEGDLDLEALK